QAKRDFSEPVKLLALKLFDDYNNHTSVKILLNVDKLYRNWTNCYELSLFTGLHCASVFGIVELVAGLIEVEGCDINQKDCVGNTPLMWATQKAHERVVQILQGREGVNSIKLNKYDQTPLCRAAQNWQEGDAKELLIR